MILVSCASDRTGEPSICIPVTNDRYASAPRILVVEDDPDIRDAEVGLLEDAGYSVAGVCDGAEALKFLREHRGTPCLIVLDLMMPVMNGFEFCAERAKDPSLSRIPLLVVSAIDRDDARVRSTRADAHLVKPFCVDDFVGTVSSLCEPAS